MLVGKARAIATIAIRVNVIFMVACMDLLWWLVGSAGLAVV